MRPPFGPPAIGFELPLLGEITPATVLRLLPFGWPTLLLDMFPAWGFLQKGAEIAIHLTPGLVQGESASDAFMSDYGARLKIAAGVTAGAALAPLVAASAALTAGAGAVLGGGAAAAASDKIDQWVRDAQAFAAKQLGQDRVDQIVAAAVQNLNADFNDTYARLVQDPALNQALFDANPKGQGIPAADALKAAGLSPPEVANKFGAARQDVAALAINALLHERVYDVSSRFFDPQTGAMIVATDQSRTSGSNSDWALIDLLNAGNIEGYTPAEIEVFHANYVEALAVDQGKTEDPKALYGQLLSAEVRGADPAYVRGLQDRFAKASGTASPDAEARKMFGIVLPRIRQGTFFRKAFTVALLTVPAWGPYVYNRWRHA